MEKMKMRKVCVVLVLATLLFVSAAHGYIGSFDGDANAQLTGTTGIFSASVTFGSTVFDFKGHVDYAVYAPGDYSGSLSLPSKNTFMHTRYSTAANRTYR